MNDEDREVIYIAGYPKSGSVFLTRLLADALDSPSGAYLPEYDKEDIATEGKHRPGPYIVRRGHFVLIDGGGYPLVPRPHRMSIPVMVKDRPKVVLIVRDPRDIAISAYHYFGSRYNTDVNGMMIHMHQGTGPFRSIGSWNDYHHDWLSVKDRANVSIIKFEYLVADPFSLINGLCWSLKIPAPDQERLKGACHRQSFKVRKRNIKKRGDKLNLGKDQNLHHMRKGQPGEWIEVLTDGEKRRADLYFNSMMIVLGYYILDDHD